LQVKDIHISDDDASGGAQIECRYVDARDFDAWPNEVSRLHLSAKV
jgi:hypothetical protein